MHGNIFVHTVIAQKNPVPERGTLRGPGAAPVWHSGLLCDGFHVSLCLLDSSLRALPCPISLSRGESLFAVCFV